MPQIPKSVHDRIPGIGWRDRKLSFLETSINQLERAQTAQTAELRKLKTALDQERARCAAADAAHAAELTQVKTTHDAQRATTNADHAAERAEAEAAHAEQTEGLRSEIENLRSKYEAAVAEHQRFTRPSFKAMLVNHLDATDIARANNWHAASAIAQVDHKLHSYALADSLGISTPEIYRVWNSLEDIEFSDLSVDRFVLKADGGHSGIAVIPLARNSTGWQTLTGREHLTDGRPSERMLDRLRQGRGPYFAEEFLESASEATIPEDIKVYTAYGQVLQVLVMRTEGVQVINRKTFTRKYFGPDGEDLGPVLPGANYGPDIPRPAGWDELLAAAESISIAKGMPFVRVDLYATSRGPVLGELTSTPGGRQTYSLDHDARLGAAWNDAEVRLQRDVARGRPPGTLFGAADYTWRYPQSELEAHPSSWPRPIAEARRWFTPPPQQPATMD
ncbi:ATP-grasp fold amidoligase family protein [Nesterenkonia sp. CF4.4]|uniref:ATP-grasp fold amidoligase family protein n=1 Tax=Nesterenkonia sp. CF4.4 TaxID=3373079 RepID=UPI003EE6B4B0